MLASTVTQYVLMECETMDSFAVKLSMDVARVTLSGIKKSARKSMVHVKKMEPSIIRNAEMDIKISGAASAVLINPIAANSA